MPRGLCHDSRHVCRVTTRPQYRRIGNRERRARAAAGPLFDATTCVAVLSAYNVYHASSRNICDRSQSVSQMAMHITGLWTLPHPRSVCTATGLGRRGRRAGPRPLLLLASATGVRCRKAFVTYLLTCGTHTYEIHSGRTRHSHTCPPGDHVTPTRASGDHEITAAPRPRLLDNRIEQSGPVCLLTLLGVQLPAVPATQPLTVAAFTPLVGVDT